MGEHGNGVAARMRKLLAHHEQAAAALRFSIDLLYGDAKTTKTNGHATVLADAIALDTARSNGHAPKARKPKRRPPTGEVKAAALATRRRTATILDALSTSKPMPLDAWRAKVDGVRIAVGPLVAVGFVRKKRGGYIRTSKTFDPEALGK